MKKFIVANWKMFKVWNEIVSFHNTLKKAFDQNEIDRKILAHVGICIPAIYLKESVQLFLDLPPVKIMAQDAFYLKEGPYTGCVSYEQLVDCHVSGSIVGHSERRVIFKEDDFLINNKVKTLLTHKFKTILCVGETLQQYEDQLSFKVVYHQLSSDLKDVKPEFFTNLVIAYEPIWAIGTGKVPNPVDVNALLLKLRENLNQLYQGKWFNDVPFLYGGSVNALNSASFLEQSNIDGLLVGGYTLKAENFWHLIALTSK